MSEEKHRRLSIPQYESLYDLNLLSLGSASGHNWTSMIQEDCLATNNQPLEKEGSERIIKTAWFSIILILIFSGAAMWILTSRLTQVVQEVSPKSIEQVRDY